MISGSKQERLEMRFVSVWKGGENTDCLWWNGSWWSWERLNALAIDCENKLRDAGFEKGQRIALIMPNSPMVLAISVACWRLGGAVAPINSRTVAGNLKSTLKMLDPAVVFVAPEAEPAEYEAGCGGPGVFKAFPDEPLQPFRCIKGIPESEDHAVIFSTSGTSGSPKAVPCTHMNILSNIDPVKKHVPGLLDSDSIILNVLPNFHAFGFSMAGMLALMSGVRQTVLPGFVPVERTIASIRESGANCIIGVPTIMVFLLGALAKMGERLEGIKFVISGGDRLNVQINARCKEYMGTGILEGYGLTECSPVVAVGHSADECRLGTVGHSSTPTKSR